MIAYEVSHNGKVVCIAGAEDLAILTTHITAVGKLGNKTIPFHPEEKTGRVSLSVTGLTKRKDSKKDVHLRWVGHSELKVGDIIQVRVLKTKVADKPKSRMKAGEPKKTS